MTTKNTIAAITLAIWLLTYRGYAEPAPSPGTVAALAEAEIKSRCVHFWIIGNSGPDDSLRKIGPGLLKDYEGYVKAQCALIEKHHAAGMWVHNPWGDDSEWPMDWDARVKLREAIKKRPELKVIESQFLPVMRRYLRGQYTNGRKLPLYLYLGNAQNNPSMIALEGNARAWKARWDDSVYPVLKLTEEFPGRVHLACDKITDLPADHSHYYGLRQLRSLGVDVIGEPRPKLGFTHLYDFGSVWMLDLWGNDRMDPDQFPDAAKMFATDRDIKGGKYCLWVHTREPNNSTRTEAARKAISRGWTPVFQLGGMQ